MTRSAGSPVRSAMIPTLPRRRSSEVEQESPGSKHCRVANPGLAAVPLVFLVAACVLPPPPPTLSQAECETADWRGIGYADGAAGYGIRRLDRHRTACAAYGTTPDVSAYGEGRAEGLAEYCTVPTGLRIGRRGSSCEICINHSAVLDACRHGTRIHDVEKAIGAESNRIRTADRAITEARAWTPENELFRRLAEVDQQVAEDQRDVSREISRTQSRIDELRLSDDAANQEERIGELNRRIEELREQHQRHEFEGERRRRHVREDHKRNREDLIAENEKALAASLESKAVSEQRSARLESQLSALVEVAENLIRSSEASVEAPAAN